MDLRQGDLGLLECDLAGRLLVSTVPARFAFVWPAGTRTAVRPRGCTGGPAGMGSAAPRAGLLRRLAWRVAGRRARPHAERSPHPRAGLLGPPGAATARGRPRA